MQKAPVREPFLYVYIYYCYWLKKMSQTNTPIKRSNSKDLERSVMNFFVVFRIIISVFGSIILKKKGAHHDPFTETQLNQNTILTRLKGHS